MRRIGEWAVTTVFTAVLSLPAMTGWSAQIDLTSNNNTTLFSVTASTGGSGFVQNFTSHPTGTGVYDPFLTLGTGGNSTFEQGYNTAGHTALYLNQQRPEWNTLLRLSDLAQINVNGSLYYGFELDSNEPSTANRRNILIGDIRIFTSGTDNTAAVGDNAGNLSALGTLRWDMSDTILLNSTVDVANGGQGFSDMMLFVPVSAFSGAGANDFLWFYNLNTSAHAGYEEWRAVRSFTSVPDGGSTLLLLGVAFAATAVVGRNKRH